MNIKDAKQQFRLGKFNLINFIEYTPDGIDWYDIFDNIDEESCKIITALLNMYCFDSIDLKVLDLDRLNKIKYMIEQINRL